MPHLRTCIPTTSDCIPRTRPRHSARPGTSVSVVVFGNARCRSPADLDRRPAPEPASPAAGPSRAERHAGPRCADAVRTRCETAPEQEHPVEGPELQFTEAVIDNGAARQPHVVRFETGLLARQAAGSATVYLDDDTMLLSATTAQSKPREAIDFFPLTVDVEERMYAAGQDPRLVLPSRGPAVRGRHPHLPPDRPAAAPLLRQGAAQRGPGRRHRDGAQPRQGRTTSWPSTPRRCPPQLAGLPFTGPVGGVRVALVGDQWVGFPDNDQLEEATFDMVVAGRVLPDGDVAIMMVEAESTEPTWNLVRRRQDRPDRGDRGRRPRGGEAVHQGRCATRRPSSPPSSRSPPASSRSSWTTRTTSTPPSSSGRRRRWPRS